MTVYVDTSVLLKLLVAERGSEAAVEIWQSADVLAAARIGYAEARAALAAAARRGRIDKKQLRTTRSGLAALWEQVAVVEVTQELVELAGGLAEAESLRGYDAVHLAAAETVAADVVATADADLLGAARSRGMHVANPV